MKTLISRWFFFDSPVDRRFYFLSGIGLMLLKYFVEVLIVYQSTNNILQPLHFLSPVSSTSKFNQIKNIYVIFFLAIWTLPFLWVGISMTVRRAENAGRSPWLGLLFLVPILNYFAMLYLSFIPTKKYPENSVDQLKYKEELSLVSYILISAAIGIVLTFLVAGISIYLFGQYGASLFFGTPFFIGVSTAYMFNRTKDFSFSETALYTAWGLLCAALAILLFALEGIICVAMAYPIALVASLMGAYFGRYFANRNKRYNQHVLLSIAALPLLAFLESTISVPESIEVITSIEILAEPEKVWENVIGFSEIPEPPGILLSSGISYPLRARIDGSGVGAVRYCEFTTGPFVEPITVWEPPYRLGFDVKEHPPAMEEWSPLRNIHPPHLDGYFQSQRGEFRLIRNTNGTTQLEGSTWYKLNLFPSSYWKLWTDSILHHIHLRVLKHIKNISEK